MTLQLLFLSLCASRRFFLESHAVQSTRVRSSTAIFFIYLPFDFADVFPVISVMYATAHGSPHHHHLSFLYFHLISLRVYSSCTHLPFYRTAWTTGVFATIYFIFWYLASERDGPDGLTG
ncbi:hypothetical protein DM02DRAFT_133670 [Periconia macrospinosa]|uniref:Uncharacterized protein n=1 Tax=Periconia macrospinosa TaxID=97972 RepID=A0A2V1E445_9PLEO|nr:hypothetical protein DM02DRAFT_133670 [Periconia macrospinosa]